MSIFSNILDLAKMVSPQIAGAAKVGLGIIDKIQDTYEAARNIATPTDKEQADYEAEIASLRSSVNAKAKKTSDGLRGK